MRMTMWVWRVLVGAAIGCGGSPSGAGIDAGVGDGGGGSGDGGGTAPCTPAGLRDDFSAPVLVRLMFGVTGTSLMAEFEAPLFDNVNVVS